MVAMVAAETAKTTSMQQTVTEEEAAAAIAAERAGSIKNECETDLATALPVLDGAVKALNTLTQSDIAEVKRMSVSLPESFSILINVYSGSTGTGCLGHGGGLCPERHQTKQGQGYGWRRLRH